MQRTQSNSKRELWCLIKGQFRPFIIRISPTSYIYDLEELILPKFKDDSIDHKDLVLMKVCMAHAS